jgi:hypothetical protein
MPSRAQIDHNMPIRLRQSRAARGRLERQNRHRDSISARCGIFRTNNPASSATQRSFMHRSDYSLSAIGRNENKGTLGTHESNIFTVTKPRSRQRSSNQRCMV